MYNDTVLLRKASQGCKDSLRRIYEMHKDHLLTVARALTGNRAQAEDVVHDVFVAFARNVPTLRLSTSLRGYLCVSVCNRVRDLARTEIRHRRKDDLVGHGSAGAAAPDACVAAAELEDRLRTALEQVPLEQREVLLLRTQAGLSFEEIGQHQGISANTARGRYRYGIDKLRSLLNSELEP
jgi:RNA polymerase sigma-70 factor (ECF subfamily)